MSSQEMPSDDWHSHVYVHFSWLNCEICDVEPDLEWAWEGLGLGEKAVQIFTVRAVERLKAEGWLIYKNGLDGLCCPKCAVREGFQVD